MDGFLAYMSPVEKTTRLPARTLSFNVTIMYGSTIDLDTVDIFKKSSLEQAPKIRANHIDGRFHVAFITDDGHLKIPITLLVGHQCHHAFRHDKLLGLLIAVSFDFHR